MMKMDISPSPTEVDPGLTDLDEGSTQVILQPDDPCLMVRLEHDP